jgi:hypothetical protein
MSGWLSIYERMSLAKLETHLQEMESHYRSCSGCRQTREHQLEEFRSYVEERRKSLAAVSRITAAIWMRRDD